MTRSTAVRASVLALTIAAGALLAGHAVSDEPRAGTPSNGAPANELEAMQTPGPQHEVLKAFEGSWVGHGSWTEGGSTSKFTEDLSAKLVFGGRFLEIQGKNVREATAKTPATTLTGLMLLGFDNAKQKYVQTMVGDSSTAIVPAEGTYDAATKTLTLAWTETLAHGKERKVRMVERLVPNGWDGELYVTQPDGTESRAGVATYRRK